MKSSSVAELDPPAPAPGPSRKGRRRGRRGRLRRWSRLRWVRVVLVFVAGFLAWLAWSLGAALTAPGGDSVAARVAEWARDHHLGAVVASLETAQYNVSPPAEGGTPSVALRPPVSSTAPGAPAPGASPSRPAQVAPKRQAAPQPALPPRLVSPAGPPLPDEGTWQVLGSVRGLPAVLGAYVRPDAVHTSYVAGVVSMDPRLLSFQLHPGELDPGPGAWGTPTWIPPGQRGGLMATFNSGFKVAQSGGAFFLNGATKGTLTPSTASMVFYKDGRIAVGLWGRDVGMTPDVVGVRQNLRLVVDHGVVPASVDANIENGWGLTIGGKYFVWRSGVGVTADGRVVFVYGPALSVRTLADLLQRAGAVEAMQLDINPAWMSFMYYRPSPDPANPTPVKLLPGQERPADRYYTPTSRDFVAVFAR